MKKKCRGISLIVLIVTIIVIIILAAALILTLSKSNPVESAREAKFKEDVRIFQDDLSLTIAKRYANSGGQWNEKINASSYDDIKAVIPSFTKEYEGKFVVQNNNLKYSNTLSDKEKEYAKSLNIEKGSSLPYGYLQVEYIESTGTQYIDTGITPNLTYGFYIDFYFDGESVNVKLLGSSKRNGGYYGGVSFGNYQSTDGGQATWFASGTPGYGNVQFLNPRLVSNQHMNCYCINNIYKTSNEETTYNFNKHGLNNIYGNIYLFAINSDAGVNITGSNLKIYEYKAYKNSEVIQDLIPCYRESDGVAGMYDIIKGEFFTNQGTGTFILGADV